MELDQLIAALGDPRAYPEPPGAVEVRQTHISAVFLAGEHVYKVKKPVNPGFLDFTTLGKRRHFCDEEVRLNRRLAPGVYLGVVPVTRGPNGLRFEGDGEPVEWAVKMRRLPEGATVLDHLRANTLDEGAVAELAARIAEFHRAAARGTEVSACATFEAVSQNARDVFDRAAPAVGAAVSQTVFDRVRARVGDELARLQPLVARRAAEGRACDGHGDLHLDHVYHFPGAAPPGDWVIIDCIEFSAKLRCADPVADVAFAVMDFAFRGRADLGRAFADAYFRASGDVGGREVLAFYTAYRAAVRGMVDGLLLGEPEVPEAQKERAKARSRGHWLLALAVLEPPERRPGLVLVGGLPGSGKSTLARELAARARFAVVRSDVVRKQLAGLAVDEPSPADARDALYAADGTERTYAECLRRAEAALSDGGRVIVDATFREERFRAAFVGLAVRCGVPVAFLVCEASAETTRARLAARRGDASDADWGVYLKAAQSWEPPGAGVARIRHAISTEGTPEDGVARGLAVLRAAGLWA